MAMQLLKADDPRSQLEKARRTELIKFARAHKVDEIKDDMPAELMRAILKQKNLTHIQVPNRVLGAPELRNRDAKLLPHKPDAEPKVVEVDAVADLARQYEAQAKKPVAQMGMNELRAECKARGVKMDRRDNMAALRIKLGG